MTSPWHPVVAVPARNEEKRLPALIESLARQTWLAPPERRLDIVAVLNNCTDRSREAASAAALAHPNLVLHLVEIDFPADRAHVGSGRRLAMEHAASLCASTPHAVLLTTDADAVPDPDWIDANLQAIEEGADLVGGLILGDRHEEEQLGPGFQRRAALQWHYAMLADELAALIDPLDHDPWPRHRDHTGASLAVRASVHAALGGMPALPLREDLGFVGRARSAGYRLRHAPDVRVAVSARLVGRAPGGMADCLKDWMRAEAEGRPHLVEAPEAVEARLLIRRSLRDLAGLAPVQWPATARALGIDAGSFPCEDGAMTVPALIERFAADDPDAPATIPVEIAIARLEQRIAEAQGEARAA